MKILFVGVIFRGIGGIESSLRNLLRNISDDNYDIDLCLIGNYVSKTSEIPPNINLIKGSRIIEFCCTDFPTLKKSVPFYILPYAIIVKLAKKIVGYKRILKFCLRFMTNPNEYDVAISYSNDQHTHVFSGGCEDYVLSCVNAKKKIAWIHNDIRRQGLTRDICINSYQMFDYVVNVSNACKKIFDSEVPEFISKSKVVTNMLDFRQIEDLKSDFSPFNESDGFNIVTVARIENKQKRIDRIIDCCELFKANGITDIHWTVVGDGVELEYFVRMAEEKNISDILTFVGHKSNAIPYMQYADLFVQTSDYEAYSMVIIESLSVGCPCLCTNYDAVGDIISDSYNGWIVPKDVSKIYEKICFLKGNPEELNRVSLNCSLSCKELNDKALNSFKAITGLSNC